MKRPKVCVLRAAGTNCDHETRFAFAKAKGEPELVHINTLMNKKRSLDEYRILALPGGFTYGDDIGAGRILANELRCKLADQLRDFIGDGKLIIGICNGFQILVKAGLLPGSENLTQEATLTLNDSAKFEDRWVYLKSQSHQVTTPHAKCIWTKELPGIIYLPVAHGEGKFITRDKAVLLRLKQKGQVVLQYCDEAGRLGGYPANPNGSVENIAGICDEGGRILGLMPHPERHIACSQHPRWCQEKMGGEGDGLQIFKNAVEYARKNL
jgi:phosphoribosylformylglycinamidine synthase I